MKTRVIKRAGKFVPQYKKPMTGWWDYIQPNYCTLSEMCDTLEEAVAIIRAHEDDGKVVWESE